MKATGSLAWRKKKSWLPFLLIVIKYAVILVVAIYLIQLLALYLLLHPENTYPVFGILMVLSGSAGAMVLRLGRKTAAREENNRLQSLSERELEVFNLLINGNSNKQICERLFIEQSTLKSHINRIYKKLDVNDRKSLRDRFDGIYLN